MFRTHPHLRRPAALAAGLLLTAAAAWLWAHEGHEALPTRGATVDAAKGLVLLSPEAREALGVGTAEVTLGAREDRLAAQATLVAPWQRHAFATSRLGGKVASVHVQPGQTVAAGQPLADVESLELENLQLELINAHNDARLSAENLRQLEAAGARGAVTEQQLAELRNRHQENLNGLEVARRKLLGLGVAAAALDRLLAETGAQPLRTLPVASPLAGVVIHAEVQVGRVVEPTEHLFEVLDLAAVWVKVAVLEKDLHRVAAGQPVELRLAAYPGEVFAATIQGRALALEPATHQGIAWAELANPPGREPRFLPGMVGQAELVLAAPGKHLAVPNSAVIRDGVERYVLVEEGPGQYLRRNVVVGRRASGLVEVLEGGLVPGDRVVTEGSHELATFFVQGVLRLSPEAEKNIGLGRLTTAQRQQVAEVVEVAGAVDLPPDRRAVVSARLAGTVHRIHVDRDQAVAAGQVVAEVASLQLQDLQLDLLRSHLQTQLLEQTVQRLRALTERNDAALSRRQLREAESARNAAVQRRDSLGRRLEVAGLSAEQVQGVVQRREFVPALPVRAPRAGNLVRFQAALGQVVKAEDALFEIHDLTRPVVRGHVAERQLAQVRLGQRARVRPVAGPELVADAEVSRSGRVVGAEDRTLSVWAELKATADAFLPHGTLMRLTVVVAEPPPVLAVPREAVLRDGTQDFVFVRGSDGVFERRLVQTGRADDRFVEITAGLREGEPLAARGVADLQTAYAALR